MSREAQPIHWAEHARFALLVALLVVCMLFGGGSRNDIFGVVIVQCSAVVAAVAALLLPGAYRFTDVRAPMALLAAFAATIAMQLVPLPPELWAGLAGHGQFAAAAAAAGIEPVWRPISLTPDLTRASLAGLVVPAAVLILFATLPASRTYKLLPILIVAILLSGLFGIAQIVGGKDSSFYRYAITNNDAAVGFFSNRNHQAVFLVMCIPMAALWGRISSIDVRGVPIQRWLADALIVFLLPLLVVTGSRAGFALIFVGLGFSWVLVRGRKHASDDRVRLIGNIAAVVIGISVIIAAVLLSRAEAITRLFDVAVSDDLRSQNVALVARIAQDFFPFGSGFGSFDPIFRAYETDAMLRPSYFNHAHNDLLELIVTGGAPAFIVAIGFIAWAASRLWLVLRASPSNPALRFALLGAAMIVMVLLSSVVDYPLRTPLLMAFFALACGWLASCREDLR